MEWHGKSGDAKWVGPGQFVDYGNQGAKGLGGSGNNEIPVQPWDERSVVGHEPQEVESTPLSAHEKQPDEDAKRAQE